MTITVLPRSVKPIEHLQKLLDVIEVQARGGLIQNVKRAARLASAEFAAQLDALRLAAGKRGGRLAQMNVPQAHIHQRLQLQANLRNIFEQRQRVLRRHVEQVGNGDAFVLHRQRLGVIAPAAANFAGHEDVGQEVHLDAPQPFALAGFAAAAFDVEAEAPGAIAALRAIPAAWQTVRESA